MSRARRGPVAELDQARLLADLEDLVTIPSVSSDPARGDDVWRSAERSALALRDLGVSPEVVSVDAGQPAVIARIPGPPDAPTVLLYAHHDVQPVGDLAAWHSPPFELTRRNDRLFGRGSADDKGGIAIHLETLRLLGPEPPVSIALLFDGEEEIGSPTLARILADQTEVLAADVVLALDSVNAGPLQPTVTESLRGLVNVALTLRTADRAAHSGIYGGAVPDALSALVRLLATLTDSDGAVVVDGLHPGVRRPGGPDPAAIRAETGLLPEVELVGRGSMADRLWNQPAVTVTAIDAPPVAAAANVLVPMARAAVSFRLAPEDDPASAARMIERHLRAHLLWGVDLQVDFAATGRGWRAADQSVTSELARRALERAFGSPTTSLGVGGGIPFIADIVDAMPGVDVVVTALQDPHSNAHAANESVAVDALRAATLAQVDLVHRLIRH